MFFHNLKRKLWRQRTDTMKRKNTATGIAADKGHSISSKPVKRPRIEDDETRWNDELPADVLLQIFQVLSEDENGRINLTNASRVCRFWHKVSKNVAYLDTASSSQRPLLSPLIEAVKTSPMHKATPSSVYALITTSPS